MNRYHYLGYRSIGGQSLRYVATVGDEWVALVGWGSAALKCGARERLIGWEEARKLKRLTLVTNNVRFLVLPWVRWKNLASRVLALNLKRLSEDFQQVYGHPVYLAETFVDPRFHGSCYRAANWQYAGQTRGWTKSGDRYVYNGRPKAVYLYRLHAKAQQILTSDLLPYDYRVFHREGSMDKLVRFPVEGLMQCIRESDDPRMRRGIRHQLEVIVGIAVCAVICGARSYRAIGDWSAALPPQALRRFGSRRSAAPSESAIRRLLQAIDAEAFDRHIGRWLLAQQVLSDKAIAIDGKTLRGSREGEQAAVHLLSAVVHKEGIVIAQADVDGKTNEITRVQPLLQRLELQGAVVTTDALLTQKDIAEFLVEQKRADYVFTVKGNQPTVLEDISDVKFKTPPNIPADPTYHTAFDKAHGRIERRTIWTSGELAGYVNFPHAKQVFKVHRQVEYLKSGTAREEIVYGISSLSADRADAAQLLEYNRGHWEIENRVHYVRDTSFDEDRSQVRTGEGPRAMASIRNLAMSIFRLLGFHYIPDATRYFALRHEEVFRLLPV